MNGPDLSPGFPTGFRPMGVLAILGATATGKTALSVELAERLSGEVISADAFAVYRGLNAGTAKPTAEERARVPHHLIDVRDPAQPYSAGEFAKEARAIARDVLRRGRLPILCGGTGFYVRAFFRGLFEGPKRDEDLRRALLAVGRRRGAAFLKRMLDLLDPESGRRITEADASRAVRYLEIALLSGRRPSRLFVERPYESWAGRSMRLLLSLPRPVLYGRIRERFDRSIAVNLPDEVKALIDSGLDPDAPGFSAIGYRLTWEYVSRRIGREEWEEQVLRDTRRLAKRQETWFRRETDLVRLEAQRPDLVEQALRHASRLFERLEPGSMA